MGGHGRHRRRQRQSNPLSPLKFPTAAVLNLWVVSHLGIEQPFQRNHVSDTYIIIHNSRKLVMKQQ